MKIERMGIVGGKARFNLIAEKAEDDDLLKRLYALLGEECQEVLVGHHFLPNGDFKRQIDDGGLPSSVALELQPSS